MVFFPLFSLTPLLDAKYVLLLLRSKLFSMLVKMSCYCLYDLLFALLLHGSFPFAEHFHRMRSFFFTAAACAFFLRLFLFIFINRICCDCCRAHCLFFFHSYYAFIAFAMGICFFLYRLCMLAVRLHWIKINMILGMAQCRVPVSRWWWKNDF